MVYEIITLPLRVGIRATRLGVRMTTRAAGVALTIAGRMIGATVPAESPAARTDARESSSTFELDVVIASPPPRPEATPAAAPAQPEVAPEPEVLAAPEIPPAHVSEGLQLVESFAEPGAEEGAGAAVHVKEPWRGYSQMTANEVIGRLVDASPEELAAVSLYEGVHRRRKTVQAEARRRLRSATASRSERTDAHVTPSAWTASGR